MEKSQWYVLELSDQKGMVNAMHTLLKKISFQLKLPDDNEEILKTIFFSMQLILANAELGHLTMFQWVQLLLLIAKKFLEEPEGFEARLISQSKGFGLIATKLFKKGDFLLFYRGERTSQEVYTERLQVNIESSCLKPELQNFHIIICLFSGRKSVYGQFWEKTVCRRRKRKQRFSPLYEWRPQDSRREGNNLPR